MTVSLEELLAELEADPQSTELVDIEQLLVAAGFRRIERDEHVVYWQPATGLTFNFKRSRRYLEVGYVLQITRIIRAQITTGSQI